jgi:hypothetical protein
MLTRILHHHPEQRTFTAQRNLGPSAPQPRPMKPRPMDCSKHRRSPINPADSRALSQGGPADRPNPTRDKQTATSILDDEYPSQ